MSALTLHRERADTAGSESRSPSLSLARARAMRVGRGCCRRRPRRAGRCPAPAAPSARHDPGAVRRARRTSSFATCRSRTTCAATALSEFAPAAGDAATVERMLEVQAIISRTYAASQPRPARSATASTSARRRTASSTSRGRLQTSRWAPSAAAAVAHDRRRDPRRSTAARRRRSSTPTAAATPAAPPTSGAAPAPPTSIARRDEGAAAPRTRTWTYRASADAAASPSARRAPVSHEPMASIDAVESPAATTPGAPSALRSAAGPAADRPGGRRR